MFTTPIVPDMTWSLLGIKIQSHTTDKKLWVHLFQESLSGTQLEWFYQLEGSNIHTWEDLATAFYRQYQYNVDLAPTRVQLQGMTMGSNEGFKEYAQKMERLDWQGAATING